MNTRECPFCGKKIADVHRDCPHCREAMPERRIPVAAASRRAARSGRQTTFRRGLLYMMAVAFIYYIMSPSSPYQIKMPYPSVLTAYLLPLFFIMGLFFALYGIYQHVRG